MLYKILFLSFTIITFSYSMHKTEEMMYQDNLSKLTSPLQSFVKDFATWSKKEQDKILLHSNSGGFTILIKDRFSAKKEYGGNIIHFIENNYTTPQEEVAFFLALDYLKKTTQDN